ncbi:Stp1/IreP family PP2C-type Ser/Thr phosphatase [Miltoncostaea marina]|uniref:Stp1/IreP family PP2C-type Ser/Thr phosphatase n=1 Tax=Miltoncostaea marina TaxID=2843215 RepID=UPI001C3C825A|nr:Stp1/IreP family PP2C-type Ser/Thr phosphatase [Miltoncostaea marina]
MTAPGTPDGPLVLVEVAHLSDTGRVRHHNEDRSLAGGGVLAVADGMGGAKAGEVAAEMAVDAVARLAPPVGPEEVRGAVERANRAIRRLASDDPDKTGMGTTLTVAMVRDGRLEIVHVGDSRAYIWRDGALTQVTEDHSVVAELVRRGSITEEEAEHHPHRNVITRALGAEAEVEADVLAADVRAGDVVLLCSDGLSSYVPGPRVAELLAGAGDLAAAARALVDAANAAGGSDNVTVVLARVGRASDPQPGDTMEAPAEAGGGAQTLTGRRVLGGLHGHAAAERAGAPPSPAPKVIEPLGRRRSRAVPVVAAALVLLLVAAGGVAWVSSRTYTLEATADGTVRVAHGLPYGLFGRDLSEPWQDTGVSADAVRAAEPGAVSDTARGQGEAVALAGRLVWRYGVVQPPVLEAPQPARPPAPEPPDPTPAQPGAQ